MRLRALLAAIAVAAAFASPALAGQKPARRLGAAYARQRAVKSPPAPVPVKSRVQSAGTSCRSTARG